MQLFKTLKDAKEFLEGLETDLDRIDCLDYLILELRELIKEFLNSDSGKSSKGFTPSLKSIKQWKSILPSLRKLRSKLLKTNKQEFQDRFAGSVPVGRRLRFPVSTTEEELKENIGVISRKNPSKIHEYLVWLIDVLGKDKASGGRVLREEETWRMALDEKKRKKDWREALWKVMNITDEFIEDLKEEEGLAYRSAIINPVKVKTNLRSTKVKTNTGFRGLIPWLGSKKQLQTLLELLYQNQIISNFNVGMISTHFWDAKNQRRFGPSQSSSGKNVKMIPWTGTQAQLKKLFFLLAKDVEGRLLSWDEIKHSQICQHFTNQKKQQPLKPENLKKLDLAYSSQTKLELIHNLLKKASKA